MGMNNQSESTERADADLMRLKCKRMVDEQIRARGITDARVLEVMERVPRDRFVLPDQASHAFEDRALGIALGQTISQPYVVSAMTAALQLEPQHRVLEVGTGSGYQTAILASLASAVYTIERLEPLLTAAQALLTSLGIQNVCYRVGDGSLGWREAAPFDGIIVTAAAPEAPRSLVDQLADGGRLVIPVGGPREQNLTVVERIGTTLRERPSFACRFVKLIGKEAWPEAGQSDWFDELQESGE